MAGRLADRLGARRTLLIGVVGFALASALGGASVTGAMLIAARAVQGAAAALLVSSTKSLLVTVFTGDEERTRAIGIFSATIASGWGRPPRPAGDQARSSAASLPRRLPWPGSRAARPATPTGCSRCAWSASTTAAGRSSR
jgi:Major Facilitator Superfamily